MNDPIEQFRKDIRNHKSIVVCMQCGSTCIDQNYRIQLKCYNCGNVSIWDSHHFTIAREGEETDVVKGLNAKARKPNVHDEGNWSPSITDSLLPLMHRITELPAIYSGSPLAKISKKDFDELVQLWGDAKTKVDAVFENLENRGDSIID